MCVLVNARQKWEFVSHVVCVISIKIERQLITFGIVLTPAHWDIPNMRSIKKIKIEEYENCKSMWFVMFGKPLYARWVMLLEKSAGKGKILL